MVQLQADAWEKATPKGTYNVVATTPYKPTVRIACPGCGRVHMLRESYIAPDGAVRPAVLCDCGFHDSVTLVGFAQVGRNVPTVTRRTSGPGGVALSG